ncbi:MAG TPA: patatin-like phospholipase family protein [Segeticoccus sp.]|nr:patatin-like phospholipase family protein [Segeticoccus sp.]
MAGLDADLVLEGGGVKGIALVGAISVLAERGYRFHRVAGTSAGAIVGAMVAAGIGADELEETMRSVDYQRFQDEGRLDRLGAPGKAISVLLESGIYEGEYLRTWLGEQLAAHGVRTFADLRLHDRGSDLPTSRAFRLVVMASDISRRRLRRLPWDYPVFGMPPDAVPVADAVRASMSIPFFYEPVKLRDETTDEVTWLVDGGMLSNFPVDVFDRQDGRAPRWPTLGIKLSARASALAERPQPVHGTISMTRAMVSTMTGFFDHLHLDQPATLARTIFVDTLGVRSTDFHLDRETQQALFASGQDAARRFLDGADGQPGWDFARYVAAFRAPEATGSELSPMT